MKRALVPIALAALCHGCYADVPLDATPQIAVEPTLLGDWTCSPADDAKQPVRLKITAKDKYRYAFSWQERRHKAENFLAWASVVGGVTVFNLQSVPSDDSGWPHPWAFVGANLSGGVLQIQLVAQGVATGKERTSEELRRSFTEAVGRSDVFDKEETTLCRRHR